MPREEEDKSSSSLPSRRQYHSRFKELGNSSKTMSSNVLRKPPERTATTARKKAAALIEREGEEKEEDGRRILIPPLLNWFCIRFPFDAQFTLFIITYHARNSKKITTLIVSLYSKEESFLLASFASPFQQHLTVSFVQILLSMHSSVTPQAP